jgi:hypothetical protein
MAEAKQALGEIISVAKSRRTRWSRLQQLLNFSLREENSSESGSAHFRVKSPPSSSNAASNARRRTLNERETD